jgi:hypothetical protein
VVRNGLGRLRRCTVLSECAKEARATAELITDATAKELLLDIAAGYEWLARRAEERTSRGSDGL